MVHVNQQIHKTWLPQIKE